MQFYNSLAQILVQFREACKEWVRYRRDEIGYASLYSASRSFMFSRPITSILADSLESIHIGSSSSSATADGHAHDAQRNAARPIAAPAPAPAPAPVPIPAPPPPTEDRETTPTATPIKKSNLNFSLPPPDSDEWESLPSLLPNAPSGSVPSRKKDGAQRGRKVAEDA